MMSMTAEEKAVLGLAMRTIDATNSLISDLTLRMHTPYRSAGDAMDSVVAALKQFDANLQVILGKYQSR